MKLRLEIFRGSGVPGNGHCKVSEGSGGGGGDPCGGVLFFSTLVYYILLYIKEEAEKKRSTPPQKLSLCTYSGFFGAPK